MSTFAFVGKKEDVLEWHFFLLDQFAIESSGPHKASVGGMNKKSPVEAIGCVAELDGDTEKTIRDDMWQQGGWPSKLRVIQVAKEDDDPE